MMQVKNFIAFLRTAFPAYQYHNGMIPKKEQQCVGVYLKGRGDPEKAVGGMDNTGEAMLPALRVGALGTGRRSVRAERPTGYMIICKKQRTPSLAVFAWSVLTFRTALRSIFRGMKTTYAKW